MIVFDAGVLVAALRSDAPTHEAARRAVVSLSAGPRPFAVSTTTALAVARLATDRRVFLEPTPTPVVLDFLDRLRSRPAHVHLDEGRAWQPFTRLCGDADVRADLVPDAWLAALALANGAAVVTADRGFARFRGLTVHHPQGL